MKQLVLDPDGFYARRSDDPSLLGPGLVVLLASLLNTSSTLLAIPFLTSSLNSEASKAIVSVGYLIGGLVGLLSTFVIWFFFAAAFYLLSNRFTSNGEFRDVFRLVGWGFLPSAIAGLVGIVITFYVIRGLPTPTDPKMARTLLDQMTKHPLVQTSKLIRTVFTLWSGMIWAFAVKHARDLSISDATKVVVFPIAVSIGISLASFL